MTKFFSTLTEALGSRLAVLAAFLLIVAWALAGPLLGFSDTWQLTINTTTTIVTFLMVFVIQNTQNRDSRAAQAKLDLGLRMQAALCSYYGIEPDLVGTAYRLIGVEDEESHSIKRLQDAVRNELGENITDEADS